MSFDVEAQSGTTAVREHHRFNEAALAQWMSHNVEGFHGSLTVEQFKGGQSNPTYKLTTPQRNYVLRRKPPGQLLKGAHAIDREARVLTSLHRTGFPVARVCGLCTDESVIGTWFFIMEMVEGRIFWDATLSDVPKSERAAYFDAMNQAIADLHSVDYHANALEDFGREGGYVARQIAIWSGQYLADKDAGRDPAMDRLVEWLPKHTPEREPTAIVHGDFRIDNIIFHPSRPRILAVLDWELSTLGNPLSDFAYHAMMYRMPPTAVPGLGGYDPVALGLPTEAAHREAYCMRRGVSFGDKYEFYIAFNMFRFAAIIHGIKGRVIRGTASNADARARAQAFPQLSALAWQQVENTL